MRKYIYVLIIIFFVFIILPIAFGIFSNSLANQFPLASIAYKEQLNLPFLLCFLKCTKKSKRDAASLSPFVLFCKDKNVANDECTFKLREKAVILIKKDFDRWDETENVFPKKIRNSR